MRYVNIYSFFAISCLGMVGYFIYRIETDGFRNSTQAAAILFFGIAFFCGLLSYLFGKNSLWHDVSYNIYEILVCIFFCAITFMIKHGFHVYISMGFILFALAYQEPLVLKFPMFKNGTAAFLTMTAVIFLILFFAGIGIFATETPQKDTNGGILLIAFVSIFTMPFALFSLIFFHFNARRKLRAAHNTGLANH